MTADHVVGDNLGGLATDHDALLQQALRLFRTLFERGSLGQLVIDFRSFRIGLVNEAFCTMTGFTPTELVGNHAAMIFPPDQDPTTDAVERLADASTDIYSVERFLQRRDGSLLPVLSTVSAVRDDDGRPVQLLVVMQDLIKQRLAEGTERRSQALIHAAIATLPVTFTTFDRNLRFTFLAGGLERVGNRPEDFIGRHASEVTDDSATLRALENALAGSESTSRTLVNGRHYLTLNAPMRDDDGAVVGVVSVSTNITAQVSAEWARRRADELRLFLARHDPLTGLLGRSALVEHLNGLDGSRESAGALLLLDLDEFNLINDSFGHVVGDAVLLDVASRVADAFPALVVARYGGDEFAVVGPHTVTRAEAVEAAERVRAALAPPVEFAGHTLRVTACIGVAFEGTRDSAPSLLVRDADSALSRAKEGGPGQYRLYDAEMRRRVQERLEIQEGLQVALSTGQLRLAYQPIVDLRDRHIVGAEALLRWTHPLRGPIPPLEFIPVAEKSGLILPIGRWVMNTACVDALPLQRDHHIYVSVNVSARQLVEVGFAEWLEGVLDSTGLPPSALTVEVTESVLMEDIGPIRAAFDRLRSLGVRVSIDDFGTGYSSLARLQRLPVDVIKLDRAFVSDIDVRTEARGMAAAILQLSIAIGAGIVAEGVETEAEAATLLDLGYITVQGYLFARPMPIEDLAARLRVENHGVRPPKLFMGLHAWSPTATEIRTGCATRP